jgi:hypothetical protein
MEENERLKLELQQTKANVLELARKLEGEQNLRAQLELERKKAFDRWNELNQATKKHALLAEHCATLADKVTSLEAEIKRLKRKAKPKLSITPDERSWYDKIRRSSVELLD